jgi:nucleoside phosphorylase
MKYLLIEDDLNKVKKISEFISMKDSESRITTSDHLSDARRKILTQEFDLIVFDIFLPLATGGSEQDVSAEIIGEFSKSRNYHAEAIAITKYSDQALAHSTLFNDHGITLVVFSDDDKKWQEGLDQKLTKIKARHRFDFIVFCALLKERNGYISTGAILGELKQIAGLNCQELAIDKYRGLCIKPSQMGLVNMAIAATKAIELFSPRIVAMSGICAGVPGESNLLDIVVGQICWEYQTGKFKDGKFIQEPYQISLNSVLKTEIEQFSEQPSLLEKIKLGLYDTELRNSTVRVAPISSGSAVIADESRMREIGGQHRKWAALEMEMYSLYEAASQSVFAPLYFGAKSVVDVGDSSKGDALHASACVMSARFVVEFLKKKLPELID